MITVHKHIIVSMFSDLVLLMLLFHLSANF